MVDTADLVGALLGTLFITLGLAAIGGAHLRSDRRNRTLIWFGFTPRLVDAARVWAGVPTGALADDVTVVAVEFA